MDYQHEEDQVYLIVCHLVWTSRRRTAHAIDSVAGCIDRAVKAELLANYRCRACQLFDSEPL